MKRRWYWTSQSLMWPASGHVFPRRVLNLGLGVMSVVLPVAWALPRPRVCRCPEGRGSREGREAVGSGSPGERGLFRSKQMLEAAAPLSGAPSLRTWAGAR